MTYVAGIHIGSTSISLLITSRVSGELVKVVTKENNSTMETSNGWEKIQNPKVITEIISTLIDDCSKEWKFVTAIGISCQMHGVLYIDSTGEPVSPLFSWQDGRGNLEYSENRTYAEVLSELSEMRLNSGYGYTFL